MMEITAEENVQPMPYTSNDVGHHPENLDPQLLNHGEVKTECEITEVEVRGILEVIAATGRFWHDWNMLKGLLSFQLKQVLSEYPEAQLDSNQQAASLGETYPELVKSLDEALHSFVEGPPFTLQRLCEILLAARSIYPNLSKLALALEKNLLVTSTLTISTDPYPSTMTQKLDEPEKENLVPQNPTDPVSNGVETTVHVQDEEMADAEEINDVNEIVNQNESITEEISSGTSETSSDQSAGSAPSGDSSSSNEAPSGDSSKNELPLGDSSTSDEAPSGDSSTSNEAPSADFSTPNEQLNSTT